MNVNNITSFIQKFNDIIYSENYKIIEIKDDIVILKHDTCGNEFEMLQKDFISGCKCPICLSNGLHEYHKDNHRWYHDPPDSKYKQITIYGYWEKNRNGMVYIGQTTDTKQRKIVGYKGCPRFYTRLKMYMDEYNMTQQEVLDEFFDYYIFAVVDDSRFANDLEQKYIDKYQTMKYYNSIPGGKSTYFNLNKKFK